MRRADTDTQIHLVRLLSFALAFLLWLSLFLERRGELSLSVPVTAEHVPPGVVLAAPPPSRLDISVSGSQIALVRLKVGPPLVCRLDFAKARPGVVTFTAPERLINLDAELKIDKVNPGSFSVTLGKAAPK